MDFFVEEKEFNLYFGKIKVFLQFNYEGFVLDLYLSKKNNEAELVSTLWQLWDDIMNTGEIKSIEDKMIYKTKYKQKIDILKDLKEIYSKYEDQIKFSVEDKSKLNSLKKQMNQFEVDLDI